MPTEKPKRSGYYARCECGCGAVTDLISDKGPANETAKSVAKLVRAGRKVEHSADVDADGTMDAFDSCRAKKREGGAL